MRTSERAAEGKAPAMVSGPTALTPYKRTEDPNRDMESRISLIVELQRCKHPPLPRRVARVLTSMSSGGWEDRLEGPASIVGFKELDETVAELAELASRTGRSRSSHLREALRRYLKEEEAA